VLWKGECTLFLQLIEKRTYLTCFSNEYSGKLQNCCKSLTNFIDGGNQITFSEPPTCCKSQKNFIARGKSSQNVCFVLCVDWKSIL